MRGRKPKPTRLKILTGNPGKRAINRSEPQPRGGVPRCPAHLDAGAKAEWRRVAAELRAMGLVTPVDRAALAAYCQAWSRWAQAELKVREFGAVLVRQGKDGQSEFYPNPYLAVANVALVQMRSFASEFGMTPSSRTRLAVEPQREADPLEEFLAKKKANG